MQQQIDLVALQRILRGGLLWVVIALLLIGSVVFGTFRIGRVSGEDVGILLNKRSGKITVINQSGTRIYNGITNQFFTLDKTMQTLNMTASKGQGDRAGKDDLKVKTIDGSDVYVDMKVQYKIDPAQADLVIQTSGPGNSYKDKWTRDYARALVRDYLGELTTEEFYDAGKRRAKLLQAKIEANTQMRKFGLELDSIVIPRKPHFYAEYEAMIKKKKLADQAVLEEQSMAQAAKQRQLTRIVEETNRTNVAIEEFRGSMERKIIQAKAEGEQVRKAADAYFARVTIGAEAQLYQMDKEATGILAKKSAEAEGIKKLKKALEGEGGRNMVKMEYARKLKDFKMKGVPYTVEEHTERFEHLSAPASSVSRGKK